jgi:hypothetical protein
MVLRRPTLKEKTWEPFWGCRNFARGACRETLSLPGEGPLRALALGINDSGT